MNVTLDDAVLQRIIRETPGKLDAYMAEAAENINNDIVQSFGISPAPPDGPPGVDTGQLRASMHVEKQGLLNYRVMDGVDYGLRLEIGDTQNGAAWPFINPVFSVWDRFKFADGLKRVFDL